ncbi:MAG: class I SAM-dependent methyltransferase [Acidobacteria bacterium]|nr:class I SAM-dependent methyltransferase [Acidobacteriota bacterium]
MAGYYEKRLAGARLRACYRLAPPRVQQHLEAEIRHVLQRVPLGADVLELGCGYGRVVVRLAPRARWIVGIDTAMESLVLARHHAADWPNTEFVQMNAARLAFHESSFDTVICVQNGISAFDLDPTRVVREALCVTRPGGRVLFSSYSPAFWRERLRWFELQAEEGLIGPIDWQATHDGTIACSDGFRAGTMGAQEFRSLCAGSGIDVAVSEIDGSSVFFELSVPGRVSR